MDAAARAVNKNKVGSHILRQRGRSGVPSGDSGRKSQTGAATSGPIGRKGCDDGSRSGDLSQAVNHYTKY